ncbi:MAG TPA: Rnase Y domain-containing protein, partial [Acidimicrobiia bacterium]
MDSAVVIGLSILGVAIGLAFGYLLARVLNARKSERDAGSAEGLVSNARVEARQILAKADDAGRAQATAYREREEATLETRRAELSSLESRLGAREETLEQRASNLAQREKMLIDREDEINVNRGEVEQLKEAARFELEKVAGIDVAAAKSEMLAQVEDEARREAMIMVRDLEIKAREEADRRARRILATAVQRLASEVVTETTVSVVQLPSDDMKGRIIGREGRNIRHLESVTGTNLIVDDTPEAVSISSFDPVRREVARIALEKLVADGRIHPASIEEAYEKARAEVEQSVRDAGEWALVEVGVARMHTELVTLIGRLK